MNEEFTLVKFNRQEFIKHRNECLDIADEFYTLTERISTISISLAKDINVLAKRLDKSISTLATKNN